jgi:PAS domain S-box-containing protein
MYFGHNSKKLYEPIHLLPGCRIIVTTMDDTTKIKENRGLSATDHAIITCDRAELITSWDSSAVKTFGWTSEEALGQEFFYLILPPGPKSVPGITLTDIISTGNAQQSEQFSLFRTAQHKDGSTFNAHILIFNVPHSTDIIILLRDLRKQQRFLEKINTSYEQQIILDDLQKIALQPHSLRLQFERILEYLFSTPSLHLLPYGAIFLAEYGTDTFVLKAKKGFSTSQNLPCTESPQGMCQLGQSAQYGIFKQATCTKAKSAKTCHFEQPHGHYCSPLQKGEKVVGILCLYTEKDYTIPQQTEDLLSSVCNILTTMVENREMDVQLLNIVHDLHHSINTIKEEKRFSESVIQGLTHGLIVTDLDGRILTFNGVAESIMSNFTDTLSGKNLIDVVGEDAAARLLDLNHGLSGNLEQELTITSATGDTKIIGYSVVLREDAFGKELGRIVSINDISEIKYVRREMEKMNRLATVAEIASAVAHEVRNPLAGIKIMAQSIEGKSISEAEQSECLTRIIRQVDRLNSLLTEFFSYARPAEPEVCATSLSEIIQDTQPLIANKMVKSHITFRNDCAENIPAIIADPNQVQQVLLNLFLNAIDATQSGGTITMKTAFIQGPELTRHRKKHPGLLPNQAYVAASITDDGIGMSPDVAEKVFEPFFTTKSTGTGLGLSIVYRTLRENNAAIIVESAPNKGSTFTIYFAVEK